MAEELPVLPAEQYFTPEVLEQIMQKNRSLWDDAVEGMALRAMQYSDVPAVDAVARAYNAPNLQTVYDTPIMKAVLDQVTEWRSKKQAGIDDGGITSREMPSGGDPFNTSTDLSTQRVQPRRTWGYPTDDPEDNRGDQNFRDDENNPVGFDDQKGSDHDEWFQKTRYPDGTSHHDKQIVTVPQDEEIEDGKTAARAKRVCSYCWKDMGMTERDDYPNEGTVTDSICPECEKLVDADPTYKGKGPRGKSGASIDLVNSPSRMPGSDKVPFRKSVPSDEGGAIGIDEGTGDSQHVVDPSEDEKPVDNFKSSRPSSNTVKDYRETTASRQIGTFRFASSEIFAPPSDELETVGIKMAGHKFQPDRFDSDACHVCGKGRGSHLTDGEQGQYDADLDKILSGEIPKPGSGPGDWEQK